MIIYKSTNLVNGKCYIGLTTKSLDERKRQHIKDASTSRTGMVFHRAMRKYGFNNFLWEVVDSAETEVELKEKEIYWIAFYNSYVNADNSNGYNSTFGGDGINGYKISEETRKKFSDLGKVRIFTDETRQKMSSSRKGKKHSEDTKQKMSEWQKGENCPSAKLTEDEVLQIKELIKNKMSITDIAKKFNVSRGAIKGIKTGSTWSHVGEDVSGINYSSGAKGSKNGKTKLTDDNVIEIKLLLKEGKLNQKEISEMYGVKIGAINRINTGKSWSHVVVA